MQMFVQTKNSVASKVNKGVWGQRNIWKMFSLCLPIIASFHSLEVGIQMRSNYCNLQQLYPGYIVHWTQKIDQSYNMYAMFLKLEYLFEK